MANFVDSPHFAIHDDYYTPKSAWAALAPVLADRGELKVWEACMLGAEKSKSPQYIKEAIPNVVEVHYSTECDCLIWEKGPTDLIITNIPFSLELKKSILKRFIEIDRPFITLMNSCNLYSNYMRDIFGENIKYLQVIHPKGKINYDKLENGELKPTKNCSFYSVYLCYKLNLSPDKLWL